LVSISADVGEHLKQWPKWHPRETVDRNKEPSLSSRRFVALLCHYFYCVHVRRDRDPATLSSAEKQEAADYVVEAQEQLMVLWDAFKKKVSVCALMMSLDDSR
jgi:hypothetical protein